MEEKTRSWYDNTQYRNRFRQEVDRLRQVSNEKGVQVHKLQDGSAVFILETAAPNSYKMYLTTPPRYPLTAPTVLAEHNGRETEIESSLLAQWKQERYLVDVVKDVMGAATRRKIVLAVSAVSGLLLVLLAVGVFLVFSALSNQLNLDKLVATKQQVQKLETTISDREKEIQLIQDKLKTNPEDEEAKKRLAELQQQQTQDQQQLADQNVALAKQIQELAQSQATATAIARDIEATALARSAQQTQTAAARDTAAALTAQAPVNTTRKNGYGAIILSPPSMKDESPYSNPGAGIPLLSLLASLMLIVPLGLVVLTRKLQVRSNRLVTNRRLGQ